MSPDLARLTGQIERLAQQIDADELRIILERLRHYPALFRATGIAPDIIEASEYVVACQSALLDYLDTLAAFDMPEDFEATLAGIRLFQATGNLSPIFQTPSGKFSAGGAA